MIIPEIVSLPVLFSNFINIELAYRYVFVLHDLFAQRRVEGLELLKILDFNLSLIKSWILIVFKREKLLTFTKRLGSLSKSKAHLFARFEPARSIISLQASFFFEAILSESLTKGQHISSKSINALQELFFLLNLLISQRLCVGCSFSCKWLLLLI